MNLNKNPLDSIIMISIPENLKALSDTMPLDASILLPVEVPEGISPEDWKMENLSWEMIISGMLKILAYDPHQEHLSYYRKFILSVKPQIIQELTQSAIIKAQTHSYHLAEEIFKAMIGLQPEELRHKLNLTILFENRSNHLKSLDRLDEAAEYSDLAEDFYLQLIEDGEKLPDIYFNGGWFFYNRQDFSRCTELMTSYVHCGDDEVKLAEARKLLKESSDLKDRDNQYREAYSLISRDRNEEGVTVIDMFLKDNPAVWNAWFLKGWALRKQEMYSPALEAFEKARQLDDTQVEVLNEMSICQLELGNYTEAEKLLTKAYSLDPENTKVISNMGILAIKQNRKEDALGFFHTVLELEPEDPIALEYIDFLKK